MDTKITEHARKLIALENKYRRRVDVQLPDHGTFRCRKCWPDALKYNVFITADRQFRVVNDPGAWGSLNPEVLVLGISKGFTQTTAYADGDFDGVPFKNCRPRLKEILVAVGVLSPDSSIDQLMQATERDFAWGSVVRCSISGWKDKEARLLCRNARSPTGVQASRGRSIFAQLCEHLPEVIAGAHTSGGSSRKRRSLH